MNKWPVGPEMTRNLVVVVLTVLVLVTGIFIGRELVRNDPWLPSTAKPGAEVSFMSPGEMIWSELSQANWSILHAPTPPPRSPRMSLPWERQSYVLISLPVQDFFRNPAIERTYRDFLKAVLPHQRVMVAFHRRDRKWIPAWLRHLETDAELAGQLDRLEFVATEADSMWIRDFGPMFGRNRFGDLIVIDNGYIDPRIYLSNLMTAETLPDTAQRESVRLENVQSLESRRGSDITPSIIAGHLQSQEGIPTVLARTPVILEGGDFMLVDAKTAIVSRSTLEANGGRADLLGDALRQYMGVEKVVYLAPLPGETIEHLDFLVKVLDEKTFLLAMPPPFSEKEKNAQQLLKSELEKVLARNKATLKREFPDHTIIEVPMPGPLFMQENQVLVRMMREILLSVGNVLGLSEQEIILKGNGPVTEWVVAPKVLDQLFMDAGVLSLKEMEGIRKTISHYSQVELDDDLLELGELYTTYRTYLNSLQVIGEKGEEVIIIPRYRPQSPAEAGALLAFEKEVLAAYAKARPGAQLVWIDCTEIIHHFGAVHCFAMTVPALTTEEAR